MCNYRYQLDKTSRKFICPQCGKKSLVRYIDSLTNSYLENPFVGRCDREVKCGYHFPPRKAGFSNERFTHIANQSNKILAPCDFTIDLDKEVFIRHRKDNAFYAFLQTIAPSEERLESICRLFDIGSSRKGGVIFFQQDLLGRIRTGKIMFYDPLSGKRIKHLNPQWIHTKLPHSDTWQLRQCLFGLHTTTSTDKAVGIVESEKTAIVMSLFFPERLWLATGGKNNLNTSTISEVPRDTIDIFADIDAHESWKQKLPALERNTGKQLRLVDWFTPRLHLLDAKSDPADLILRLLKEKTRLLPCLLAKD